MSEVRLLERGTYWGGPVVQRDVGCALLTLSEYAPNTRFPLHEHQNSGVFLLVRGSHRETDRVRVVDQAAMSLLWHRSDIPHETEIGPDGALGLNISLDANWLREIHSEQCAITGAQIETAPFARTMATRVLAGLNGFGAQNFEEDLIALLSAGMPSMDCQSPPQWLSQAMDILNHEFRLNQSLATVARRVGIHRIHLARTFRRWTRLSVGEYLQLLRLEEALRLVIFSDCTIADAAVESGFSDQAHLARMARRYWGCSSQQLRSILKKKAPIVQV